MIFTLNTVPIIIDSYVAIIVRDFSLTCAPLWYLCTQRLAHKKARDPHGRIRYIQQHCRRHGSLGVQRSSKRCLMRFTVGSLTCTLGIASFPGLPRFFCSSVSVDNNTRMRKGVFRRPSASVYYCQRKPKNRKNGVGLGTRLLWVASSSQASTKILSRSHGENIFSTAASWAEAWERGYT